MSAVLAAMSAYAAAYAPPTGIPGKGKSGGYGGGAAYGRSDYGGGFNGTASGGKGVPTSYSTGKGVPTSYAPPGTTQGTAGGKGTIPGTAGGKGAAPTFSYSGIGGAGGWPSADQLVAAVPVRPFEFTAPSQKVRVGDREGISEYRGVVPKPFAVGEDAEFFLLKKALTDGEVAEILATGSKILGESIGSGHSREADPTDGRPRFAVDLVERGIYSSELSHVLKPLVDEVLLPYVRQKYNCQTAALSTARFRRYVPEERRFVAPHHEHSAFAAMSLGLQEPKALTGGLFVQGSGRAFLDRKFVPQGRGDACVHQYDLHHGVEVQEGSRYELLLFFKDSPQAVLDDTSPWYTKLAEAGDAAAQYGLAMSHYSKKDYQSARIWIEKACAQDYPEALYVQADWIWQPANGTGVQADTARALQLLRRAAELGHGRSQSRLGGMLVAGVKGRVQQDSWEGKRLLRLAFEQDDPDAAFHLGQALLQEGDRDGATKLLAACAKGHPRACFQAAEMYREGQYQFPKDVSKSLTYTKWAAHQGDAQAMSNLGHLLINGMGVIRDDAKAVRLFRQAAKLGAAEGELNYGLALLRGNGGVKVDYQEALQWAQKSAAQGHTLAHQQLSMFFNAAKNPNPPARSLPTSKDELRRLSVKELRDLLRTEGIDFSDCVEKADLIARAAQHLLGVAEPWDAAPEHTLLLEPPKRTRAELLKARQQQAATLADTAATAPAATPAVDTSSAATVTASTAPPTTSKASDTSTPGVASKPSPAVDAGGAAYAPAASSKPAPAAAPQVTAPFTTPASKSAAAPSMAPAPALTKASPPPAPRPPKDDEFEAID